MKIGYYTPYDLGETERVRMQFEIANLLSRRGGDLIQGDYILSNLSHEYGVTADDELGSVLRLHRDEFAAVVLAVDGNSGKFSYCPQTSGNGSELSHGQIAGLVRSLGSVPLVAYVTDLISPYTEFNLLGMGVQEYVGRQSCEECPDLLLMKINKAMLERPVRSNILQIGGLTFDLQANTVSAGEKTVELTPSLAKLVQILYHNQGRILDRNTILTQMYGDAEQPQTNILNVYVNKIRKALNSLDPEVDYGYLLIKTAHGAGFYMPKNPFKGYETQVASPGSRNTSPADLIGKNNGRQP